ncbi:MAG: alpha/beta fold hydrolase [Alphaproteobacteria bacterium]|nr:alpha/beta fold hydrolase [Alphaproteobacteria bacterium]
MPLRGGFLGKPVNSNLVADDKHRIDGNKRVMHEDWARIINKAPDFNGILPTFKYHVETNGDAGRADVADMLWRASQTNPSQAQSLQRELAGALGGETIPMRRALLVGEEVPKQNASGNSLLGPQQPAKYDIEQMRKSYWQSMETYKAELAQKQQETQPQTPMPKEEQRQTDPGKRGVISTNPDNPAYPDRGNFADKLWGSRVKAKPFVDEPRKGTYYFGGAGMDGAYIGDMVKAMQENGVGNAKAVDPAKWTDGEKVDAAMTLLRRNRDSAGTDFSQFGKEGKQFNMVGYSHGGLQAAQAAADYAEAGGKVDHLVLVGTPISQEFLDRLKSNPNIGKVVVKDIEGQGDPIRAGMSAGEQIMSLPKLTEDQAKGNQGQYGFGHFYYAGSDAEGMARRRELAKQLYDWGLR